MPKGAAVADHDHSYKKLFSHPEMVEDLIRGFVHEDWVQELDFSTLERVSGSFVTDNLKGRETDLIWRVRWGRERWLYVYLVIELQSTVDPFMALRMMVYSGLLLQLLVQQRQLTPSGKLPPILPLVLYNGFAPWGAARDVAELIDDVPGGLERYRPQLRYCLVDEMRIADSELASLRNVAAALFRLEKNRGAEDVERVLTALSEWLRDLPELRRSFAAWLRLVLLPARLPGVEIPQVTDLEEVRSMMAERVKEWTLQWKQEGFEEGLERGLERGLEEGLEKGRSALALELERRFGPLPAEARQRVESLGSIERIVELSARAATAPSLAALGLS